MKVERQPSCFTVVSGRSVPLVYPSADHALDETFQELRHRWPDTVDLAKQPGLLYRLHAMLNS